MGMFSWDRRPLVLCDPEKGAKQSFKEECDINTILDRHRQGAMVTHVNANQGRFADVSRFTDYREVLERVERAREYFLGLSSEVRNRFQNDPAYFLDFVADPANTNELVELGLGPAVEAPVEPVAPPEEEPVVEEPVDPPAA